MKENNKTTILILWKQEFDSKQRILSITIVGMDAEGVKLSTPELVVLPPGSLVTYTILHTAHKL